MGNESKVAFSFFPEHGNGSLPLNLAYGYSRQACRQRAGERKADILQQDASLQRRKTRVYIVEGLYGMSRKSHVTK